MGLWDEDVKMQSCVYTRCRETGLRDAEIQG